MSPQLNIVSIEKGRNPFEKYEKIKTVACDDLTAVCVVKIRDSYKPDGMRKDQDRNQLFAMKFLNRSSGVVSGVVAANEGEAVVAAAEELRTEVERYCTLPDHPNIVRVFDIFEYHSNFYIVMEFCQGGNLIGRSFRHADDHLKELHGGPFPEYEAAKVVGELLHAVRFLHDQKIVHGELRLENILYESDDPQSEVKIVDLGMSRLVTDKSLGERENYVKNYAAAPETYRGEYTTASDMWAIGVITFVILSGCFPFSRDVTGSPEQHVKEAKYDFQAEAWEEVSEDARDFIKSLIVADPSQRLTAGEALVHKWMKKEALVTERKASRVVMDQVKSELQLVTEMTQFHKIVLNTLAHLMSHKDIRDLRNAFETIDTNGSGIITFKEFKSAMSQTGLSEEELAKIFDGVGIEEERSKMSYLEFLAATLEYHTNINEADLIEAFGFLDKDHNGYLRYDDIMTVYPTDKVDAIRILDEVGAKDGTISLEAFLRAFRRESDKLRTEALDPVALPSLPLP